jgi:menaquinone-9 beta-reductase
VNAPRPIEILGGGLAGLSLGLALRRADIPVTLYEAGDYPRHRVCGEFITGLTAETVARLGLAPFLADALQHRELTWFIAGKPTRAELLPTPALGLSRHTLDARLAAAFVAAGGDLRAHTRVTDLSPRESRVFATGRRRGDSGWIGLKVHARGVPLERDLELHLAEQAYVGLSRVESGAVNICGLFQRRPLSGQGPELLKTYLRAAGLDELAGRLSEATFVDDSFCAVAALTFDAVVPPHDRICLGDACAMIPPFTGNGMAMAFQSAETALDPLVRYGRGASSWEETVRVTNGALARRFRVRLASAGALHPFLLQPRRQRWFAALSRARLLPFRPLYAALH